MYTRVEKGTIYGDQSRRNFWSPSFVVKDGVCQMQKSDRGRWVPTTQRTSQPYFCSWVDSASELRDAHFSQSDCRPSLHLTIRPSSGLRLLIYHPIVAIANSPNNRNQFTLPRKSHHLYAPLFVPQSNSVAISAILAGYSIRTINLQETQREHHVTPTAGPSRFEEDFVQCIGTVRHSGCSRRRRIRCRLVSFP